MEQATADEGEGGSGWRCHRGAPPIWCEDRSLCNPEGCLEMAHSWERENRVHRQILGFKFGEWGNLIHKLDLSCLTQFCGWAWLCVHSTHNILFAYSVHISMWLTSRLQFLPPLYTMMLRDVSLALVTNYHYELWHELSWPIHELHCHVRNTVATWPLHSTRATLLS